MADLIINLITFLLVVTSYLVRVAVLIIVLLILLWLVGLFFPIVLHALEPLMQFIAALLS